MLLENDMISLKQTLFILISKGFKSCEIWYSKDYLATHFPSKPILSSQISAKQIDLLVSNGMSLKKAQQLIILKGSPKLSKKNLSLLGTPLIKGSIEALKH